MASLQSEASIRRGTILITGANGGLGVAMVRELLSRPDLANHYHGIYPVREASFATRLRSALKTRSEHSNEILSLDLTRLDDVRRIASDINMRISSGLIPPIRALILNAAFLEFEEQTWTQEGYDMAFASAYLGHWLLTLLLLQSLDRESGRILVIGSSAHDTQDKRNNAGAQYVEDKWRTIFNTETGTDPIAKGTWSTTEEDPTYKGGYRRYGAAKLCQVMMIPELQRRLDKDPLLKNISVLGVDPGSTPTYLVRRGNWMIRGLWTVIMPWLVVVLTWIWPNGTNRTTKKSAGDLLAAAFDCNPVLMDQPRGLYLDGEKKIEVSADAKDPNKTQLLWKDTVRYANLKEGETVLENWA